MIDLELAERCLTHPQTYDSEKIALRETKRYLRNYENDKEKLLKTVNITELDKKYNELKLTLEELAR